MRKFISFLAVMVLLVGIFLFGGCKRKDENSGSKDKKSSEGIVASQDFEYMGLDNNEYNSYTVNDIAIDLGEDSDNLEIKNTIFKDNCFVCYVSGFHSVPSEDEESTDVSLQVDEVFCYNYDGELLWKLDVLDSIAHISDDLRLERDTIDSSVFEYNNDIYVSTIKSSTEFERQYYVIDVGTGVMTHESKSGAEIGLGRGKTISNMACNQFNGVFKNYKISQYYLSDDGTIYLSVTTDGGEQNFIDVKSCFDFIGDTTNVCIKGIYPINQDEVLLNVGNAGDKTYYKLNIREPKVEPMDVPPQFLCAEGNIICYDDMLFFDFGDGILKMNPQNGEITEALNYNKCFFNVAKLHNATLVSMQNNKVVYKTCEPGNINLRYHFYVLSKNKNFDYDGKHKLIATSLRALTYANAEAIVKFNNSNDEYFIEYTSKYQLPSKSDSSPNSVLYNILNPDKEVASADEVRTDGLTSKIVTDMNNGQGPDIILEADAMCGLYAEEHLKDLSSYIDEIGFSREDYFSNIVNLMRNGGRCVQIPLSFEVPCLLWNTETNNQLCGFSIDEYKRFIEDNCQGVDPLSYGYDSIEEVETLFNNLYDEMLDGNGEFNVDNDEFRQIVEFCKSNDQDISIENIPQNPQVMKIFLSVGNIDEVEDRALCGFPSNNRRTPSVNVFSSIAINESCGSEQAIREFIKLVLSDDIQRLQDKLPVSKKAFSDIVTLKCSNDCKLDGLIDELNNLYVVDDIANRLIRREIKRYFNGMSTLEEAIKNINKNYYELYHED